MSGVIDCTPLGFFSWGSALKGEGHSAVLTFSGFREKGTIEADGESLVVVKEGLFSGAWQLQRETEVIAWAKKRSAFTRTFDLDHKGKHYVLSAESCMKRAMILDGPDCHAVMEPAHAFTRRATIHGTLPESFPLLSFGYWLMLLILRRCANDAAAGG